MPDQDIGNGWKLNGGDAPVASPPTAAPAQPQDIGNGWKLNGAPAPATPPAAAPAAARPAYPITDEGRAAFHAKGQAPPDELEPDISIPEFAPGQPDRQQLAFKNNNPGNLKFAGQPGATEGEGGYARFENAIEGYRNIRRQIGLDAERGLSLDDYIAKFAPSNENDTATYQRQAHDALGVEGDTPLAKVNFEKLAQFQATKESSSSFGTAQARHPRDLYNTPIPPKRQADFQTWAEQQKAKLGRDISADNEDYDITGAFLGGAGSDDDRGHFPDLYKKPNHPTFSVESKYSGQPGGPKGGRWVERNGKQYFYASPDNLTYRTPDQLQAYFDKYEPDVNLVLPNRAKQTTSIVPSNVPGIPGGTPPGPARVNTSFVQPITAGAQIRAAQAQSPGGVAGAEQRLTDAQNRFGSSQVAGFPGTPPVSEAAMLALPPAAEVAGGVAAATESAAARQGFAALDTALNTYFTYKALRGGAESVEQARQALANKDYAGVVRQLGAAGINAAFAGWAADQSANRLQQVANIAKLKNTLQNQVNAQEGERQAAERSQRPRITGPQAETPPAGTEAPPAGQDLGDGWRLGPAAEETQAFHEAAVSPEKPPAVPETGRVAQAREQAIAQRPQPAGTTEPVENAPETGATEPQELAANPPATSSTPPNPPATPPSIPASVAAAAGTAATPPPEERGPGWLGYVPVSEINVDAPRFQFKRDVGQGGAGEKLREVQTYDPDKAGVLQVWKDSEEGSPTFGKTFIVNGHHRLELANRAALNPDEIAQGVKSPGERPVAARYLDAKDAQNARLKGALINIAEDQGTSVDAAKVFRDSGKTPEQLQAEGLSMKGKTASEGLALANLAPNIFDDVIQGDLAPARGAVLGSGVPNHADQQAVYDLVKQQEAKGKRLTNDQIGELIRLNNRTSTKTETNEDRDHGQGGLFGVEEMTRSLLPEKAEVSDYVRAQLKTEKKLFGAVSTQAAADRLSEAGNVVRTEENLNRATHANQGIALYDKLSTAAGPIDQVLDQSARRLADGESPNVVKQQAYRQVRDHLSQQIRQLTGNHQPGTGAQEQRAGRSNQARPGEHDQVDRGGAQGNDTRTAGALSSELGKPEIESSRVPRLSGDRSNVYPLNRSTLYHSERMVFEPHELDPEDAEYAAALTTNLSGMEYLQRLAGRAHDERFHAALHLSPANAAKVGNLARLVAPTAASAHLASIAREAGKAGKSLIVVRDYEGVDDAEKVTGLHEEIDHAVQSKLRGNAKRHLTDDSARELTATAPGKKAVAALAHYGEMSPGEAAAEIGVRLMRTRRYQELGLTLPEARSLGADYVRLLKKEHGSEPIREIERRVGSALDEPDVSSYRPKIPADAARADLPGELQPSAGRRSREADAGSGNQDREVRSEDPRGVDLEAPRSETPENSAGRSARAGLSRSSGNTAQESAPGEADQRGSLVPEAEQRSLVTPAEALKSKAQTSANERKLLHDQLTAQLKSGGKVKPSNLKPAENRSLFTDDELEQGNLFGSERGSFSFKPKKSGKLEGVLWDKASKARKPGSAAFTKRLDEQNTKHEENLRAWYTGQRDRWSAAVNQELAKLRKVLPDPIDQEALAIYRDFKNKPGELKQWLSGSHQAFGEVRDLDKGRAAIEQLRTPIERAMNPTPAMQQADQVLTKIADVSLREGQALGFIDKHVSPEEYVTHLLFRDHEEQSPSFSEKVGAAIGGKLGRNFPYNQQREFPTILDAAANGWKPKTLNAFTAFEVYGDKFATARATHLLIERLRATDLGVWGTRSSKSVPQGWVEIAPHAHPFRNLVTGPEGEPAYQTLFVPPFVEKALQPITDPNYMNRVKGFRALRAIQQATKGAQLGFSFFHAITENYMGLWSMGPRGYLHALKSDRFSPEFLQEERDFIGHGGTSDIQHKLLEGYRAASTSALPTWREAWRSLPAVKQIDRIGEGIAKLTFGKLQRQFKVANYSLEKAAWLAKNPDATEEARNEGLRSIAKAVNAVYGGLHWENLGVNAPTLQVARAILLAPDWTISNFYNVRYAFERGTPAGSMARKFWLRAAIGGLIATQLASLMLSGKHSKRPTQVYMGTDKEGKDIYQNVFFKGAPGDLFNLVGNVWDYGAGVGLIRTASNKASPVIRAGLDQIKGQTFLGHEIAPKGMHPVASTVRSGIQLGKDLAPIPWSAVNTLDMLFGPDAGKYKIPLEVLTTLFAGTPPTHIKPKEEKSAQGIWDQIRTGKVAAPSVRPLPRHPERARRAR